jgi:hypothetical protein
LQHREHPDYIRYMSPEHRRFLLLEQGIGSAVFNFVLNGVIAWALFRSVERVPMWGQQSIAGDTIGTCFFLPFFTALIVTPLVRRRVQAGGVSGLDWTHETHPQLAWLPAGTGKRAVVLGAVCALVIGSLSVLALTALGVGDLGFWPFVGFKATFAAGLALLVTPVIAVWAMTAPVVAAR